MDKLPPFVSLILFSVLLSDYQKGRFVEHFLGPFLRGDDAYRQQFVGLEIYFADNRFCGVGLNPTHEQLGIPKDYPGGGIICFDINV